MYFDYLFLLFLLLLFIILVIFFILIVKRPKNFVKFLILDLFFLILGGIVFYLSYFNVEPRIIFSFPSENLKWDSYSEPIEINFNIPIEKFSLVPNIRPFNEGEWVWEDYFGISSLTRKGKFYPSQTYYSNQRIVVYITGIKRMFVQEDHENGFSFDSINIPKIINSTPADKAVDVLSDQKIILDLDKSITESLEWEFVFSPTVEFIPQISDKQITLNLLKNLDQGVLYSLFIKVKEKLFNIKTNKVIEEKDFTEIKTITFATAKPALVRSYLPQGYDLFNISEIQIEFENEMDISSVEDNFSIEPNVLGDFNWDGNTLIYKLSSELEKETRYKVKVKKNTKTLKGGYLDKNFEFEFTTIGEVKLLGYSPIGTQVSERENITLVFNQQVDRSSVESRLTINPAISGNIFWDGNTLVFIPSQNYSYDQIYSVYLSSGIKSILGVDSRSEIYFSFKVRTNEFVISGVPLYLQPQPSFSCNIYTAMMGLGFRGYFTNAVSLISEIGYNSDMVNDIWTGNPYIEYVGNNDGSWGYGVYWDAIQRLFLNRGIYTEIKLNWDLSSMAFEISQNRPVIIWRYNGVSGDYNKSWTSSDGTFVYAINGQHGSVVIGFRGTVSFPTHFLLNDPWYGQFWIPSSSLDYYWSRMNKPALVVF